MGHGLDSCTQLTKKVLELVEILPIFDRNQIHI